MFRKELNRTANSKISNLVDYAFDCVVMSLILLLSIILKVPTIFGCLVAEARDRSTEWTCGGCRSRLGKWRFAAWGSFRKATCCLRASEIADTTETAAVWRAVPQEHCELLFLATLWKQLFPELANYSKNTHKKILIQEINIIH